MTTEEILKDLCYYDELNPEGAFVNETDTYTIEELKERSLRQNDGACYCDNCFYGRTKLANELLRYITR